MCNHPKVLTIVSRKLRDACRLEVEKENVLTKICPFGRKCNIGPVAIRVGDDMNESEMKAFFCYQAINTDEIDLMRQKKKAKHHESLVGLID
jgi:hypothetical protein